MNIGFWYDHATLLSREYVNSVISFGINLKIYDLTYSLLLDQENFHFIEGSRIKFYPSGYLWWGTWIYTYLLIRYFACYSNVLSSIFIGIWSWIFIFWCVFVAFSFTRCEACEINTYLCLLLLSWILESSQLIWSELTILLFALQRKICFISWKYGDHITHEF